MLWWNQSCEDRVSMFSSTKEALRKKLSPEGNVILCIPQRWGSQQWGKFCLCCRRKVCQHAWKSFSYLGCSEKTFCLWWHPFAMEKNKYKNTAETWFLKFFCWTTIKNSCHNGGWRIERWEDSQRRLWGLGEGGFTPATFDLRFGSKSRREVQI